MELVNEVHADKPMDALTPEQKLEFLDPDCVCHFCEKRCDDDRVRDHCHLTGEYRGPAHNTCNIEEGKKNTRRYKIPVVFHNLTNYDGHLIIREVGEHTSKIDVIPRNYEKYISFSFNHFKFLDSAAFLAASLDTLASNLYDRGRPRRDVYSRALQHPSLSLSVFLSDSPLCLSRHLSLSIDLPLSPLFRSPARYARANGPAASAASPRNANDRATRTTAEALPATA